MSDKVIKAIREREDRKAEAKKPKKAEPKKDESGAQG